ncbi:hypothetical protein N9C84_03365 [Desulfobacterales bacterium]|nr:hypothetical protein [Desulfobacterales bacterium]
MTNSTSPIEPIAATITDLVGQFLDMARNSEIESPGSGARQAGLMYELDTLVSDFLDQNQLSVDEFNSLEQQVLNTIAEDLLSEGSTNSESTDFALNHDELGNFDAESVFTALDLSILEVSVDQPNEAFVVDGIDG